MLKSIGQWVVSLKGWSTLLGAVLVSAPAIYFYSLYQQLNWLEKYALLTLTVCFLFASALFACELYDRIIRREKSEVKIATELYKKGRELMGVHISADGFPNWSQEVRKLEMQIVAYVKQYWSPISALDIESVTVRPTTKYYVAVNDDHNDRLNFLNERLTRFRALIEHKNK